MATAAGMLTFVGLVVVAWCGSDRTSMAPTPDQAVTAAPVPDLPATACSAALADASARPPVPVPTAGVTFPDGLVLPPLNGVTAMVAPAFHPRLLPYSPVVGTTRDASGRDWYLHANGVRSTVYLDSRGQAVADVELPQAAVPALPDETVTTTARHGDGTR